MRGRGVRRWPGLRIGVVGLALLAWMAPAAADPEQTPAVATPASGTKSAPESKAGPERGERREEPVANETLVYRPPSRGRPRARVGGGVRGVSAGDAAPRLVTLAPDHTGETIAPRPSLFWYVSSPGPPGGSFVFALVDPARIEPVLEIPLERPDDGGVQRVDLDRLADPEFILEPDVEYEWSVSLVLDPRERARDVVGMGWIDRVPRPDGLAPRAGPVELARRGLWYDALAAVEDGLDASPGDARLEAARRSLLEQGGVADRLGPPGVAAAGAGGDGPAE
jgi:hypothetical protein